MRTAVRGYLDFAGVKLAARGRWFREILPAHGFNPDDLTGNHGPCPKCGGTKRFRAMVEKEDGPVICNDCFAENNGDGIDAIAWLTGCTKAEAGWSVHDQIGMSNGHSDHVTSRPIIAKASQEGERDLAARRRALRELTQAESPENSTRLNIVEVMAKCKRIPLPSFIAFGAKQASRGKLPVARVPMYDAERVECSHFDLADNSDLFRKGMAAKGQDAGLFVADWPAPGDMVLIVEGVKDAGALHSLGYKSVGIPTSKLAAKFAKIFAGCHVVIVHDLDTAGEVASVVTASRLEGIAASIRIARLPGEIKDSDGDGVREVLARPDGESLVRMAIQEASKPPGEPLKVLEPDYAVNDPSRLATLFQKRHCTASGQPRNRRHGGQWWKYNSTCYEHLENEEIQSAVVEFIQNEFEKDAIRALEEYRSGDKKEDGPPQVMPVKRSLVNDVMQHLVAKAIIPAKVPPPFWLANEPPGFDPREVITTKSGIINLGKLTEGDEDYLTPPTPDFFTTSVMPFSFVEDPGEPAELLKFLNDVWPNCRESIQCLQEWIGHLLVPDTRPGKILLIVGPRRSGKGTIARIIRALLGESNVAGPTLAGLATNFGLWALIGKLAAIIADARLSTQTDSVIVTERLLSVSGEDGVTIDRKNLPPITTTLPTRFVLMTNELPRLSDASNALSGRFVILRMENSFFGREDQALTDRLLQELPQILAWAIKGWARLRRNQRFTVPKSSRDLMTHLEDSSSPISAFIRDKCKVGAREDFEIEKSELFEAWKEWCEEENRSHPGTAATFGIQLRASEAGISSKRDSKYGHRKNLYLGIRLKISGDLDKEREEEKLQEEQAAERAAIESEAPENAVSSQEGGSFP